MTQNNYLCETDQFILKPNNQLRQMGKLEIKRNKRFPNQTIDSEINLSGNKKRCRSNEIPKNQILIKWTRVSSAQNDLLGKRQSLIMIEHHHHHNHHDRSSSSIIIIYRHHRSSSSPR